MNEYDLTTPTKIIKSKRKSISLVIKSNGDFIVRAPLRSKETDIFKFINQKENWIISKRKEQMSNIVHPLEFNGCEHITLLSKEYQISYHDKTKVEIDDNQLKLPKVHPKQSLIAYMKKLAKQQLNITALELAKKFNFSFSKISISSATTCWGSCSAKNNLHFTYKLVMCPKEVIEYIVLHELCHTKVKNHSKDFWSLVAQCDPNYKEHEKWLKKNRGVINVV